MVSKRGVVANLGSAAADESSRWNGWKGLLDVQSSQKIEW
jgi:hypothetical protein